MAVSPDIVRLRKPVEGRRILDLGCGTGDRAIALARRGFNIVSGLDAARNSIDLAARQAVKQHVDVAFVCGDPNATPFPSASFDEVMILGGLFGHTGSARADILLLQEAKRLLKPGGCLHLKFSDGDWIRANYRPDAVEGLPTGFIYRQRALSRDGHVLRTTVLSSSEEFGIARQEIVMECLYSRKEMTALLDRLGFGAITYDDVFCSRQSRAASHAVPSYVARCKAAGRSEYRHA